MLKQILCAVFVYGCLPLFATATVVTVNSFKTDDTHFEIWASVNAGDSAGIASYSVRLEDRADIVMANCINYAPAATFFGGPGAVLSVGFTMLRSCDNQTNRLTGSQDTLSGTTMVYNVGLADGDLNALKPEGWMNLGGLQTCYGASVILVKGTTDPGAPAPALINCQNAMQYGVVYDVGVGTYFNVFVSENGTATKSASCTLADPSIIPEITLTPTPTPTPEPGVTIFVASTPTPEPDATPTILPSPFPLEEPTATPAPSPEVTSMPKEMSEPTPTPVTSGSIYELTVLGRRACPGFGLIVLASILAGLLMVVKCKEN